MKRRLCMLLSMCLILGAPAWQPAVAAGEASELIEDLTEAGQNSEAETAAPVEDTTPEETAPADEAGNATEAPADGADSPADDQATEAPAADAETPELIIETEQELVIEPLEPWTEEATEALIELESETETEQEEKGALPKVGDVVYGFEAKEIRPFAAIGAQMVLFEHQRTHAQLMYIANDDNNRVFDLTFFTDAIDKTGLPHVFEHSVLDGSEKYPSKTLWFNVAYQTYNTYMNAFTQSRLTSYPVASLSEAQLLKYADYYTDACLHPLVVEDESIFREEAWRYRLDDADSDLTIEGTVYSEMLGAFDIHSAAYINAMAATFPGSTIGNEYGGEPDYIPDMTFEALQNYHSLYYHPSNSIAYLYGQFEDYTAFLAQLDQAYAAYDYREFNHADPDYVPLTEKTEASFAFPVEQGSSTENSATVFYSILCPGTDDQQELILNTLTDLLSDNASALQQSLQAALPSGSFASFISTDGPEDAIVFQAMNVNEADSALFRDTVDAALAQIAQEGFPQDQVDGVMATLRISTLLMREDSDVGVNNIIPNLAYSHAATGEPFNYVDYVEGMAHMDEWNQQGLYAKAVSDWLLNAQASALVTTYPQPGLKEEKDAALAEALAQVKEGLSEEEIAALVEATNAEEPEEDNTAAIADMQAVTVESLPEECKIYEVRDTIGEDGVRRIEVPAQVDGVGQAGIFLDASGVAQEDIHWMKLLSSLPGQMDTESHTKAEIASLISRYMNGGEFKISLVRTQDSFKPYLSATWIGLDEDLAEGYDLLSELLYHEKLEDTQKVAEAISSLKADLKTSISQSPYNVQIQRARAVTSELYRYYDYCSQLAFYAFLEDTEAMIESDPEAVTAHLQAIAQQMNNRTNAVAIYGGNEESIALNRPLADAFLASLGEAPIEPAAYDLPVPARSEGLIVDNGVQFNGEAADYATLGLEGYDGGLDAVTALVLDALLYPQLRDQYGSYGVFHGADEHEGAYIISYRDPNIAQTFDVYAQLHDQVAAMENDQSVLNGYILSSYAYYAKSQGELSGALSAAIAALENEPQDKKLTYMRQLKQVTPETVAKYVDMYGKLYDEGVKFSAGPASAINAEADRYEVILNPFGAVDYSQQGFEDLPEDSEYYDAVLYAMENGFLTAAEETRFGVEDPATEGDLIAAMYVLIGGGSADVDAAIETFAQYGVTDVHPDEAITGADADEMFNFISGNLWGGEGSSEELTRGQLAKMLQDFMGVIEAAQNEAA